ncbi:MAG: gp436 family protein [Rhodospirillales bacterium]
MPYSTQSDIQKLLTPQQLVQLTDDDRDGLADAAVVTEAIAQADGVIDSYLARRYTVPLTTVPAVIRAASVDIGIWNLYARRSIANESREKRYNATIAFLRALADGKATLGITPAPATTEEGGPQSSHEEGDRTFTTAKKSEDTGGTLDNF